MALNKFTFAGGWVLGSQIAFQTAYCGYRVSIWLRSEESIQRTREKLNSIKETYEQTINLMDTPEGKSKENWANGIASLNEFNKEECLLKVSRALMNITLSTDLKACLNDADLLIESIIEDDKEKINFYKMVSPLLPEKTVIVTNSSTFLPSKFAKYTGRPKMFLSLHFANAIWKNNTAEIMAHKDTDNGVFMQIMEFANLIKMVAIPVSKENPGYLVNSMLIPFLFSALDLYVKGTSDYKSIDTAWKLATGMPHGPFELLDRVGIPTAYKIASKYLKIPSFIAPYNFKGICKLLKSYVDQGKYGVQSGEGFYSYK